MIARMLGLVLGAVLCVTGCGMAVFSAYLMSINQDIGGVLLLAAGLIVVFVGATVAARA